MTDRNIPSDPTPDKIRDYDPFPVSHPNGSPDRTDVNPHLPEEAGHEEEPTPVDEPSKGHRAKDLSQGDG